MRKLILATENFPYGRSEKTFILPELERLRKHFAITVVSHASREQVEEGVCVKLPEDVRVVCFGRPVLSVFDKIRALFFLFTDCDGRTEIREILKGKEKKKERLYQSLAFLAQSLSDQKKLRSSGLLSDEEPVIYYSFWYTYYCYSMVREQQRHPDIPIITRTHGIDLYHERIPGGRQPFRHQMEGKIDAILFACEYGANYYKSHVTDTRTGKARLHICKLGTERPTGKMPVSQSGQWELLSCSNMIPLKRIHLIIDGLSQIEGLSIHWTHLGDGSEMQLLRDRAHEKLGSKKNIKFTFEGYVQNVRDYYEHHQVDCFITVSESEGGCPVSIQEAMSYGIPVIGTAVGGITEMLMGNGILLPATPTVDEIAEAICKVMTQNEQELQKMKQASYWKWEAEFTVDSSCDKILKILNDF